MREHLKFGLLPAPSKETQTNRAKTNTPSNVKFKI